MTGHKTNKARRPASALREVLARQEAIFASPLIGVIILNESGRVESLNPVAARMCDVKPGEARRRSVERLIDLGASTEIGLPARLRQLITRDDESRELTGRCSDGSTFPIDFALAEMPLGERLLFVMFVRDISKRKRNERIKDEFVATVSHELRTPLTSIAGSLGLLVGGAAGNLSAPAARLLQIAYSNSQRLVRLINDILDIEKIESGKATFDVRPVELLSLVEQAIDANRGFADGFGVALRLDPQSVPATSRADADRITQVITNLLSNAIKFSPENGEVVVAIEKRDGMVRVAVRDHGPGIPEAFKPRIFEKFAQAAPSHAPGKQGSGLGLNIVKQIVEAHGGAVAFDMPADGGTVFYVDLPCIADLPVTGSMMSLGEPRSSHVGRPRVLHVDDDGDVLHVVAETLRGEADVVSARSITEARQVLGNGGIDLAVLDLGLADGDGLDLLAALHKPDGAAIPAVIFSGRDADAAVGARVDAVLTKSRASLDRLAAIVRRLAATSGAIGAVKDSATAAPQWEVA
jgi:PAS domain S-box-containing protein